MRTLWLGLMVGSLAFTQCAAPADEPESEAESADALVTGKSGGVIFASPTIVREGTTYHAWVAKHAVNGKVYNVAHATRGVNEQSWKLEGDALPKLGAHTDHTGGYAVWAPAVAQIGPHHWMLYYSATLEGTAQKKCIWRAHAPSPNGPFVDDFDGPIECVGASEWVIDPYLVKDEAGDWFLSARIDEPGGINTIQIRKLGPEAENFAPGSSWRTLTRNSPGSWEQPVLENAAIVRLEPPSGEAHWFVFYSARAWSDDSYAVGYADCGRHIEGPCEKKTVNGPWLATDAKAGVFGPGTPTFYTNPAGDMLMSVQAWEHAGGTSNAKNHGEIMRTYRITVGDNHHPSVKALRVDL